MWEINSANQASSFALALVCGAMLCLVYDILRALRKVGLNSFWVVFFTDIFFWVFSAFFTFIFLMARTNGEIRGFVLAGELLGFIVCRVTLSRLFFAGLYLLFKKAYALLHFINRQFSLYYVKFERIIIKLLLKILKKSKSAVKSVKKLLKNNDKLLYTNNNNVDVESIVDESKTSKRRNQKTEKTKKG